jgi:CelD/BcsL family acetyltransferase involved in cellulose biosynthesis
MQQSAPALANPFLSAEFATAVGRYRAGTRVAVLTDAGETAGFFPFDRRQFGLAGPVCGWLSPCQGLVHSPDADWDPRTLLRSCGLVAWQFDNLIADQKPFRPYHACVGAAPVIDLDDGFDAYYARLRARAPRLSRELARKGRKLARDVGPLRLVTESQDSAMLRVLMSWKSQQYRRTAHVDRFSLPWVVGLLDELLVHRSEYMSGMLCVLYAGDQPIAAQFGLRAGWQAVGWFTGYNPQFRHYSPGLLQIVEMARAFADIGITVIHMGKGAAGYTQTLKSHDIQVAEGMVTTRSVLGAAQLARTMSARRAARLVRRHPALHGAADQLLRRTGVSRVTYGRI